VAVLREQGVNGHAEMAWAFHAAGFRPVDVHMSDLIAGAVALDDFTGAPSSLVRWRGGGGPFHEADDTSPPPRARDG